MRIIIDTDNDQMRDVVATFNSEQAKDIAQLLFTSGLRDLPESTQIAVMDLINGLREAAKLDDL